MTIGEHFIKSWATTQASITLSSAEAELVAMTKATAETIGVLNMVRDLGQNMSGVVSADSSAALAIADRKGSGKLRHINIRMLWLQEKERRGEVELRKIRGAVNPADLMTKYLPAPRMQDLMRRIGQHRLEGRAQTALEVQGAGLQASGVVTAVGAGALQSLTGTRDIALGAAMAVVGSYRPNGCGGSQRQMALRRSVDKHNPP